MSEAKTITRVVYRTYPAGDVIALLLDCEANLGRVVCYQHSGQHGEGVYFEIMESTRPATEEEIAKLRDELIAVGYAPIFRLRRTTRAGSAKPSQQPKAGPPICSMCRALHWAFEGCYKPKGAADAN